MEELVEITPRISPVEIDNVLKELREALHSDYLTDYSECRIRRAIDLLVEMKGRMRWRG